MSFCPAVHLGNPFEEMYEVENIIISLISDFHPKECYSSCRQKYQMTPSNGSYMVFKHKVKIFYKTYAKLQVNLFSATIAKLSLDTGSYVVLESMTMTMVNMILRSMSLLQQR